MKEEAYQFSVIVIKERFFAGFKNGRVTTAWHVAGAKQYIDTSRLEKDCRFLCSMKKDAYILIGKFDAGGIQSVPKIW